MPILLKNFRPEFINRIDAILAYRPLEISLLVNLVKREFDKLAKKLATKNISFNVADETIEQLLKTDYNPLFGARPVKRLVANNFEMPIAEQIITGNLEQGAVIDGTEPWLFD